MNPVRAKKYLGQHFLNDKNIAANIAGALTDTTVDTVIEIGPGMGILTSNLLDTWGDRLMAIEVDNESVTYLEEKFPALRGRILENDFLKIDLHSFVHGQVSFIGNLPYNISSQIFFKILDMKDQVKEVVCMIQKEVADRIRTGPGSKEYGILSVFLQAYFDIDYLFKVNESVFTPPPRVKSAVLRFRRNNVVQLDCDEGLFFLTVKTAFNQRRKTMRNAIKGIVPAGFTSACLDKRAEQLSVADFVSLVKEIQFTRSH
jgi:16S rRNA (adenine1518-N6/adenine1519-N6)-dimethyltransferase